MGASLFEPINVYKPVLMRIDCRYRVRELIKIVDLGSTDAPGTRSRMRSMITRSAEPVITHRQQEGLLSICR